MKFIKYKILVGVSLALVALNAYAAGPIFSSDIIINEANPTIFMFDTDGGDITHWNLSVDETSNGGVNEAFHITSAQPVGSIIKKPVIIQNSARTNALRLIGNHVGMGTAAPAEELHIFSPNFNVGGFITPGLAAIRLESEGGGFFDMGSRNWDINGGTSFFSLEDGTANTFPFKVEGSAPTNSLVIDSTANIGMGTNEPESALHVKKPDAQILVTDNSITTNTRTLLRMINNGGPNFSFQDSSNGIGWQFAQTVNGDMAISKEFSGGSEFIVQGSGRVRMGPGAISNFDLRSNGNLLIPNGSVTANGILLTSSRATKTDIREVKPSVVMQKLKKMELAEWRYKKADKNDRHISPMAEDFYSLFNLGPSNKHINPNDLASVALIAAKELQKKSETMDVDFKAETFALKSKTTKLEVENKELKARLASLEKLVTNLAMGSGSLSKAGKIAFK